MLQLSELDLHYLGVEQQDFANDPCLQRDAARAVHPWLANTSFGYIVTQYRPAR